MLARDQQADSYRARSYWLKQMGFANYEEYLLSPLWAKVRRKVILRAKGKCVSCGGWATQVHHERYHRNDLLGKNLRFLKAVCGTCHQAIEFTWRNPKKLSVKDANARLRFICEDGMMKRAKDVQRALDAEFDSIFRY